MAAMGRDIQAVTRFEQPGMVFMLQAQASGAREQHDPFPLGLVVPVTWRAGLT
ncbi:hypothetical protein D3C71_1932970 [compost metagenome]